MSIQSKIATAAFAAKATRTAGSNADKP